jgi:hypothetical protein
LFESMMSFWPLVLAALIGIPFVLLATGMVMIFAAAGLANGLQPARANRVVQGWFAFAWVLAGMFCAFGVVPAWRAWHGGPQDFVGGLRTFLDCLAGVGLAGMLAAAAIRWHATVDRDRLWKSPWLAALRWPLLALGLVPWAALAAWVAWPLVLCLVHGTFRWPDASTGWTHTGEIAAVLVVAMLVEEALRRR